MIWELFAMASVPGSKPCSNGRPLKRWMKFGEVGTAQPMFSNAELERDLVGREAARRLLELRRERQIAVRGVSSEGDVIFSGDRYEYRSSPLRTARSEDEGPPCEG
jgi:hypothetical protein